MHERGREEVFSFLSLWLACLFLSLCFDLKKKMEKGPRVFFPFCWTNLSTEEGKGASSAEPIFSASSTTRQDVFCLFKFVSILAKEKGER